MDEGLRQMVGKLNELIRNRQEGVTIVAVDGRCASGKTTLAEWLADQLGAGVIHMDDFFLPAGLRTEERLREAGGNVHYERFAREVLPRLEKWEAFRYKRFDCRTMEIREERLIPGGAVRIVEGSYSCHPFFGNYMTYRIFCDCSYPLQCERIRLRNGETALTQFQKKWIPLEESYFALYGIRERADIVLQAGETAGEKSL